MTIPQESPLPHSARTIAFLNSEVVCLAYGTDHVLFSLDSMSMIEIYSCPCNEQVWGWDWQRVGMSALCRLWGIHDPGLGSKLRPCVTNVGDENVLIAKRQYAYPPLISDTVSKYAIDDGLFIGVDGKLSRKPHISWPAPPEDVST